MKTADTRVCPVSPGAPCRAQAAVHQTFFIARLEDFGDVLLDPKTSSPLDSVPSHSFCASVDGSFPVCGSVPQTRRGRPTGVALLVAQAAGLWTSTPYGDEQDRQRINPDASVAAGAAPDAMGDTTPKSSNHEAH